MAELLGPGTGEDELAVAEFEPARLISSGVPKDNAKMQEGLTQSEASS